MVRYAYFRLDKPAFIVIGAKFGGIVGIAFSITANNRARPTQGRVIYGRLRDGGRQVGTAIDGCFDGLLRRYRGDISAIRALQGG